MASGEQLKALLKSHADGDDDQAHPGARLTVIEHGREHREVT